MVKHKCTLHQLCYPYLYKDSFKDDYFQPVVNAKEYWNRVRKGYKKMKTSKISIVGLAYNLGKKKTEMLIKRLKILSKHFKDYRVVIYCIDSQDDTYYLLKKSGLKISIPKKKLDKNNLSRVQKMSKLRNICKKHLQELNFNSDYVLLQDCDMASALSLDGLANTMSYMDEYDALFANGVNNNFIFNSFIPYLGFTYYDTFAYKSNKHNNLNVGRGYPPFKVKSAFGGAGIYKYNLYNKFNYDQKEKYKCEHVTFHNQMKKYNLGINPSLLLFSGMQGESNHK